MKTFSKFCLLAMLCCCISVSAKTRKALYIIVDGIPADVIERLQTPNILDIASKGAYHHSFTGGEVGTYTQTATISAIGYTNLLTSTWYNKHNVGGNSNLQPNYNYWSIFRIAKEQEHPVKTAIYSSWTDNRTVLIGEGKEETGRVKIDFVKDGYDLDEKNFPHREKELHIFDIDERISMDAAEGIKKDAPEMSWVYLWYPDDAAHINGNGKYFDEYVLKADKQIGRIWEAVKYREANFDEEWMVVVTTDHGRQFDGYGHGGQSERERTSWISTNVPTNKHFNSNQLAIIDITPSICRYLGFTVPRDVLWEQDGQPFIGETDICNLQVLPYDETVLLTWDCYTKDAQTTIYAAASNHFKEGGKDEWMKIGTTKSDACKYNIDLTKLPKSKFYKFVVVTPNNHINRWYYKK